MEYLGLLFSIGLFIFASAGYIPPVIILVALFTFLVCLYKIVDDKNHRSIQNYNPPFWDGILLADVVDADWSSGDSE